MFAGTLAAAVGSYVFQVVGGRALGADAFAPVTVVWTVLFLGLTVFLLPVEQLIIRRLTLGGGASESVGGSWRVVSGVVLGATLVATGFAFVVNSSLLDGDLGFVAVTAVMIPTHGLMMIARGFLGGRGRFPAYGAAVGLDAFGKAGGAVVVALLGWGPVALAAALAASPVLVFAVRPFRPVNHVESLDVASTLPISDHRFMTGFVVATAASQTVLAAGPLVVGALGASGAAISVFFVTTTLFRGPMSASYNLLARILPGLTRRAAAGDHEGINRIARRLAFAGGAAAVGVGAAAAALGPAVVELLYGAEFRPSAWLAALAAAGVIVGIVGLGTMQVLVGRGDTDRMAFAWLAALAGAVVTIFLVRGDATIRVAAGFFSGEAIALVGLTLAAVIAPKGSRATEPAARS